MVVAMMMMVLPVAVMMMRPPVVVMMVVARLPVTMGVRVVVMPPLYFRNKVARLTRRG
jgi:hypothetical protein